MANVCQHLNGLFIDAAPRSTAKDVTVDPGALAVDAVVPAGVGDRGPKNGVFGKPRLCPLPKRGGLDENGENDEFAF